MGSSRTRSGGRDGLGAIDTVLARGTAGFASTMRDVPTSIRRAEDRSNYNSNFKIVPVKLTLSDGNVPRIGAGRSL
jgi:hypothetical protein